MIKNSLSFDASNVFKLIYFIFQNQFWDSSVYHKSGM